METALARLLRDRWGHHDPMTTLPDTPFARVDRAKVERNIARLRSHLDDLGVTWRPHVKTSKALEPTAMIFDGGTGPITVSTLALSLIHI